MKADVGKENPHESVATGRVYVDKDVRGSSRLKLSDINRVHIFTSTETVCEQEGTGVF